MASAASVVPAASATVLPDRIDDPARRFPWLGLTLVWIGLSVLLLVRFWPDVATNHFSDVDDLMRLLQVRDVLHGQGWFDMTQHRLDPPFGLPMHWSRLVDLPLIAVIAPLTPLFGEARAEQIAVALVPLVTLGVTMIALMAAVRRLLGPDPLLVLLAPFMLATAPAVLIQMFPTRIDHHGWQICAAAVAFAGLLDRVPRRGGLIAGAAVAIFLSISLEGVPYAVAVAGILALLWAAERESATRLTAFMASLAVVELTCFVATAPTLRWTTPLCDVVKPAHVEALIVAAIATALVVQLTKRRGAPWRLAALGVAGAAALAAFAWLAPECLGSPFGRMDPLVQRFWYDNVVEGLPFYDQTFVGAVSMLAFPIVGLAGAVIGWRRAETPDARRRWLLVLLIAAAAFLIGAMVRRAAGLSHVLAIPGALLLVQMLRPRVEAVASSGLRILAMAVMIFALSPLMPVFAAGEVSPDPGAKELAPESGCGVECGLAALDRLPPGVMFNEVDIGPRLIAATRHDAYVGGYHRMEKPLHNAIQAFIGSTDQARSIICGGRFDYVLLAPGSGESALYRTAAPHGFASQLIAGRTPAWLTRLELPTRDLAVYRIDHGPSCRG